MNRCIPMSAAAFEELDTSVLIVTSITSYGQDDEVDESDVIGSELMYCVSIHIFTQNESWFGRQCL